MLKLEKDQKDIEEEVQIHGHIKMDAVLRNTASNYIRLICNADRKARNMLLVNSFFLAISVTMFSESLINIPYAWISAVLLLATNLSSLFFVLRSVRPNFSLIKHFDLENNLIHYKKCSQLSLKDYMQQVKEVMADNNKILEVVIRDIYYYGNLLNIKYKLIRYAYRVFSWGMIASITSYLVILLLKK